MSNASTSRTSGDTAGGTGGTAVPAPGAEPVTQAEQDAAERERRAQLTDAQRVKEDDDRAAAAVDRQREVGASRDPLAARDTAAEGQGGEFPGPAVLVPAAGDGMVHTDQLGRVQNDTLAFVGGLAVAWDPTTHSPEEVLEYLRLADDVHRSQVLAHERANANRPDVLDRWDEYLAAQQPATTDARPTASNDPAAREAFITSGQADATAKSDKKASAGASR